MTSKYQIYLDVCCLNRPFDDQNQQRIRLESEAVIMIINRCILDEWELITSNALEAEIDRTPDRERVKKIGAVLSIAKKRILINEKIEKRIFDLHKLGFSSYDAAHISSAEQAEVDILLTTDDRLLRKSVRYGNRLKIRLVNPIQWLTNIDKVEVENDDAE